MPKRTHDRGRPPESEEADEAAPDTDPKPKKKVFPGSLCHDCAAPPRFITNRRGSTFLYCPILKRYPPQPVVSCTEFRPVPRRPS